MAKKKLERYRIKVDELRDEAEESPLYTAIYHVRDPGLEDDIAFEINCQMNPFWVNQREKPPAVWAWWDGHYRRLEDY
mgnify:CR=1 FL=1